MTTTAPPETDLEGSGGRRWRILPSPDLSGFADAGDGLPQLMRVLLAHRGVSRTEEARAYLGSPRELTDPALMPNLDLAVARLEAACRAGERIAILGDFDVDGITSTTILTEGLRDLGADPLPYIPHRFTEGYGPNVEAIRGFAKQGASVLVTADCGSSSVDEIDEANRLGLDVIVIDHHTVPDRLPAALALVNPKLGGSEYGSEPAAVGVAYKVIHDLYERMGCPYDPDPHRALVALGTVCDLAPMVAENRDLVRLGMGALRQSRRPGLLALADVASIDLEDATPDTCGWVLGPRLNAAGRMDHAKHALELLLTEDDATAARLAKKIDSLNTDRRESTAVAFELATELLSSEEKAAPLIIVASPTISAGIVGLVASNLVSEFYRPAIVMQILGDEARASCRSIEGFDITALLRRHEDLFDRFGGHRAAAGFSVATERLPELRERLIADAATLLETADLVPTIPIDCELPLSEVNGRVLQWLGLLGPHGIGNATPTFLARDVTVEGTRLVGRDERHLQFTLREGAVTWRAISFGNADYEVPAGERADIVYTFKRDDFMGQGALQLEVLDLRPAS